jgi:hypothetical protein
MPTLGDYQQFDGRHWETGAVHNFMAHRGFVLPHNGKPPSEALLMGISGGAVMGYFPFAYEGYDPQVNILTRNTFDPLETLLSRLGVEQHIRHTASAGRARRTLIETLEEGTPAIVWADPYSLAYNNLPHDEGMWGMFPILVFGFEEDADVVHIADRARVALRARTGELREARGRVKKTKHRLLTLGPPNEDKLAAAVSAGIHDCLSLYLEKPPKGAAHNFGFAAYRRWADLLTKPKMRGSWAKEYPPGRKLYAVLTSTFNFSMLFGKDDPAERTLYSAFLDEAAVILGKPALSRVAAQFRQSAAAWQKLSRALLPDDVPLLQKTRALMVRRHSRFLDAGNEALDEIKEIDRRLADLRDEASTAFPLDEDGVSALHRRIAECVMEVHDVERSAVGALQEAFSRS